MSKIVFLTGGSSGIGLQTALALKNAGCTVYEMSRKDADHPGIFHLSGDVTKPETIRAAVDAVLEKEGRIDILVNNAGVSSLGDVWNIPEQDIHWVYETNVYSHWYMMGYFIPQMQKQGNHCQILNVCSIAGLITLGSSPAYFSSKHAAVGLSEVVYKSLKAMGSDIDVSVFCPGFVQTEMWKTDRHRPARFAINDDPYYHSEFYEKMVQVNKSVLDNGSPLEPTIEKVFDMLGTECFYILTHEKYDALLRAQGVYQANKTRPVELADVEVEGSYKT